MPAKGRNLLRCEASRIENTDAQLSTFHEYNCLSPKARLEKQRSMETKLPCKGCGVWLPADTTGDLCPNCLAAGPRHTGSNSAGAKTVNIPPGAVLARSNSSPASPFAAASQPAFAGYRIIRALGQGGMGAVYEAEEMDSGRRIALKVLSHSLNSLEARKRFLREGRLAASVSHPNTVYVFGTDEIDGQPVIAMELVSGGTLHDSIAEHGPMPTARAVDAILQVLAGLEAAAAVGVLHRDIKPSNCFVETDGTVKVGDFGLSVSTSGNNDTKLTMAGSFVGTPAFSSPEQLRGDEFTIQGDIYAVGVTLYYLLTGRTPFEGDDLVRMLTTVLERPPESPAKFRQGIPRGLCRAVLRCLEKQPGKRFKTYSDFRNALMPYSSAAPSPATISLRFLAACFDAALLSLVFSLLTLPFGQRWAHAAQNNQLGPVQIAIGAGAEILAAIYFAIFEGLWGASLGKRICRLRVVGLNRSLPGVPRAFARAALVRWVPMLPVWLATWLAFSRNPSIANAVAIGGFSGTRYIIIALFFMTARRRNGYAAVQDLLTGTRVIRQSYQEARPGLESAKEEIAGLASAPQMGPYQVLETLRKSESDEMLLGFDPRLNRKVWIRKQPADAPPIPASLRSLGRVGRLRWLNGRHADGEHWDAYEAVPGKPPTALIARRQPWSRVRFWLLDLAEEIDLGQKSQSSPEILALDRVWITADGRAKLLDFPAPGCESPSRNPHASANSSPDLFLNQMVVSALEGRTVAAAEARPVLVTVPLPFHAHDILQELQTAISPSLLVERLRPLLNNLATVSRRRRFALIAACCALPVFIGAVVCVGLYVAKAFGARTQATELDVLGGCLTELASLQTNSSPAGGFDGLGSAAPASVVGASMTWNGIPFKFGPPNAPDVVASVGQTIPLPPGHFTNITLVGAAVQGHQSGQILHIKYSDEKKAFRVEQFSDWRDPKEYSGEGHVVDMAHLQDGSGGQTNGEAHLYGYTFPLNGKQTTESLTLPKNASVEFLAMTLEPPATIVDLAPYFNQANGIVIDGSRFGVDPRAREAMETYIAGRFRGTVTNVTALNGAINFSLPENQRKAAMDLMSKRPAPSDAEFKAAAKIAEPMLKGELAEDENHFDINVPHPILVALAVVYFGVVFCAAASFAACVFHGGILIRTLGVAVVRHDGAEASRRRMLLRSFIAWLPALASGPLFLALADRGNAESLGRAAILAGAIVGGMILALWAALLPERGLHDRLASTCLVPRE